MAPELVSARAMNIRNVFMEQQPQSRERIQPRPHRRARAALGCELGQRVGKSLLRAVPGVTGHGKQGEAH